MGFAEYMSLLQTVSVVFAIILAIVKLQDRGQDKAGTITEMRVDIKYIKEKVTNLDPIPAKVIQLEESVKSAHKRLDEHIGGHKS